jgi:Zn-dependent protease
MLSEPASRPYDREVVGELPLTPEEQARAQFASREKRKRQEDPRLAQVREWVAQIFDIEREHQPNIDKPASELPDATLLPLPDTDPTETVRVDENVAPLVLNPQSSLLIVFEGRLNRPAEQAYDELDAQLAPLNLLPLFREVPASKPSDASTSRFNGFPSVSTVTPSGDAVSTRQLIYIVQGRTNPRPRSWIINAVLLVVTLFSVMLVGRDMAISEIRNPIERLFVANNGLSEIWRGLPYALSIMLILGAHELGHYFAARRHKIAVTLPYFIPFPGGLFGTFGAFIQLRQPIKNRKILLEIGAAGPLAGLIFAIPILIIGLATSVVEPPPVGGITEGNSLLYALAKIVTFGQFLPNGEVDVLVNQLAWAGWTGLFVTGLNLIPIGQLDGGHVLYSLVGQRARLLYFPIMAALVFLMIFSGGSLFVMILLLLFLGRSYAVPLDDITPLDPRHRWLAIVTLVVFVLVFVPIPLSQSAVGSSGPLAPGGSAMLLPLMVAGGLTLLQRVRSWLGI